MSTLRHSPRKSKAYATLPLIMEEAFPAAVKALQLSGVHLTNTQIEFELPPTHKAQTQKHSINPSRRRLESRFMEPQVTEMSARPKNPAVSEA